VPVISVGNITTGGTGKTPMVLCLLDLLTDLYATIVVVSRGYKRKSRGVLVVSDGKGNIVKSDQGGDEPVLIACKHLQSPVLVAEKRRKAIKEALIKFSPDLIILDDAFQHRSVYRDCDIVLLSVNQKLRDDKLLPLGHLREPVKNLKRADIYIVTGLDAWEDKTSEMAVNDLQPLFKSSTQCVGYVRGDMILQTNLSVLSGKSAIAFCAIANPNSFHTLLEALRIEVVAFHSFTDHHRYRKEDFLRLISSCRQLQTDYLITTEKDLVKWNSAGKRLPNLIALSVKTVLLEEEAIRQKIQTILDMKTKID
jgi:tetraacyldisaccharide 4'-kinase